MKNTHTIQTLQYPISFKVNSGVALDAFLENKSYSKLFVLMDENTYTHCYPILMQDSVNLAEAELLVIDEGEENKSIEIASQLWESLTDGGADRHSLLINLGGGLISDLGGFVASAFKRGIDFVNIPTTLLAMVDASIGGKTGVNLGAYKNQIGLFAVPQEIIIDLRYLDSLPQNQILSAFAEMLKHGLIEDKKYWESLTNSEVLNSSSLASQIEKSILIKKNIVEQDPTEKGLRKMLNFGHSIGHAIESYYLKSLNPYSHGEAVALGMLAEAYLSVKILGLPQDQFDEINKSIRRYYDLTRIQDEHVDGIAAFVMHDKKVEGTKLNFSLIEQIGKCKIDIQLSQEEIINAIKFLIYD